MKINYLLFYFLVLFIIFLFERLYENKIIVNNYICISLIIPSTLNDLIRCFKVLIKSVCSSIVYPYEIVLVVSGIGFNKNRNILSLANHLRNCTNRLIIVLRKHNNNAATNRNIGYKYSHCPIISFFDVDDVMSIYRIFIIYKIFNENNYIDVFFHPSTHNYSLLDFYNMSQIYNKYKVTNQFKEITKKCRETFTFDDRIYKCDVSNGFYITNGWPTIKRNIMDKIKFNESLSSTEDLDFISRIVDKGYKVALFKMPLGYYVKDNFCKM